MRYHRDTVESFPWVETRHCPVCSALVADPLACPVCGCPAEVSTDGPA